MRNMGGALHHFVLHHKCHRSARIQTYSDGFEHFFTLPVYARKYNEPLYAYLFYREAA